MITFTPTPDEAHSLCWRCVRYKWDLAFSMDDLRPIIVHTCKKNQTASDDVWICKKFLRKPRINKWIFIPVQPPLLTFWRKQKVRIKENDNEPKEVTVK